jgi:bifunctional DNase/RNase
MKMTEIELIIDSIRVSLMNYQRVIIFKEKMGEKYLPIWVGTNEADAIAVKIQGVSVPRPLTHDYVCAIISSLKAEVERVVISDLYNDTFYAKTVLKSNNDLIEIDCRPSDAIAVALRANAPIYVNETVLSKAGIRLDQVTDKPIESPKTETDLKLGAFSDSFRSIMSLAAEESKLSGHSMLTTGDILVVLIKSAPENTKKCLQDINIVQAQIQNEIDDYLKMHPEIESVHPGPISESQQLSQDVKESIEISIDKAKQLKAQFVQPEHILFGLVKQGRGVAGTILNNRGVSVDKIESILNSLKWS